MYPSDVSILRDYKQDLESWEKELYALSAKPFGLNKTTSMVIGEINRLKDRIESLERKIKERNVIDYISSDHELSREEAMSFLAKLYTMAD